VKERRGTKGRTRNVRGEKEGRRVSVLGHRAPKRRKSNTIWSWKPSVPVDAYLSSVYQSGKKTDSEFSKTDALEATVDLARAADKAVESHTDTVMRLARREGVDVAEAVGALTQIGLEALTQLSDVEDAVRAYALAQGVSLGIAIGQLAKAALPKQPSPPKRKN
jgi:hypothetical protein